MPRILNACVGEYVLIKENAKENTSKVHHWNGLMDSTIGKIGVVISAYDGHTVLFAGGDVCSGPWYILPTLVIALMVLIWILP